MIILETDRLFLRHLEPSDLDDLAEIYACPETTALVGGPLDRNQTFDQILRIQNHYRVRKFCLWAAVLKDTGKLIGRVGLIPWTIDGRDEVELAWLLARAHWGRGLATEAGRASAAFAFRHLPVTRLISLIATENSRSRRVAEKLGMRYRKEIDFRGMRPGIWELVRSDI